MTQPQYTDPSSELQTMIYNELYDYPYPKPCSNGIYCLVNHSLQSRPFSTTSILLSTNRQTRAEIIMYLLYKFDIYLVHDRAAVCLGHNVRRLYLHPLPLIPSMKDTLSSLKELWIVVGQSSFSDLGKIVPYFHNLNRINLEHDMTDETISTNPNIFLVNHCNSSHVYHYPPSPAQTILISESKQALESQYHLPNLGYHNKWIRLLASILSSVRRFLPWIGLSTNISRDLRRLLTRPENQPVPGVRIVVHLRCPMRLCEMCVKGGNPRMFRDFEKRMVSLSLHVMLRSANVFVADDSV